MFLDAEGRKLLKHAGPRTVKGFEDSLEEVRAFQALQEKARAGNARAATEVFLQELRLEWYGYEEARARAEALEKVTSKQKKELAQLLVDTEVRSVAEEAGAGPEGRRQAGAHFLAMWEDGRVPADEARLYSFWSLMADHAEHERDKRLFKKIVAEFEDALKRNPRYRRSIEALEERLKSFPKK